jgi:hypothetical protein
MYYLFFRPAFFLLRQEEQDDFLLQQARELEQQSLLQEKRMQEHEIQKKQDEIFSFAPQKTIVRPPALSYAPLEKVQEQPLATLTAQLAEQLKKELLHD